MGAFLPEPSTAPGDDHALAARVRSGDSSAEDDLARLFGPRILTMMRARIRDADAARDLSQEALMAVLHALRQGQLRDADRLTAFVHGVARNIANNYLRTRRRQPVQNELADSVPDAD